MSVDEEYDEEGLRKWSRVVVEVNTSWRRIVDHTDGEYSGSSVLLKDDYRTIAYMIVGRWLFPKNKVKSTSLSDLKRIYMPAEVGADLMGQYEYGVDKRAYDKVRLLVKELEDAGLIARKRVVKEVHFVPTSRLMEYCMDCCHNLNGVLENV